MKNEKAINKINDITLEILDKLEEIAFIANHLGINEDEYVKETYDNLIEQIKFYKNYNLIAVKHMIDRFDNFIDEFDNELYEDED